MPRKRRGRQLDRTLKLLRKFTYAQEGSTIEELQREYGASRRTIYRDLSQLERAGFRFEHAPDDRGRVRWRFTSGQRRHLGHDFTERELMSLYFCMNLLAPLKGTPLRDGLESVLTKIESSFTEKDREHYSDLIFTHVVKLGPWKDYGRHSGTLAAVSRATLERAKVRVTYTASAEEQPKTYLFHPYCLAYAAGDLYTIGFSEFRGAVRTLRIDRIGRIDPTSQKFDRPKDFDPEDYLGRGLGMYAEGETTEVRIEFSGAAARSVREKEWHPTQRITEGAGGRVVLRMQVQGLEEVARWVLYHAPNARVQAPRELRRRVADLASGTARRHR